MNQVFALYRVELVRRVVVACAAGVLVTGIAWMSAVNQMSLRYEGDTRVAAKWIRHTTDSVREFQRRYHRWPQSLSEAKQRLPEDEYLVRTTGLYDEPLHLDISGAKVTVRSYGKDDQPGGVGWNFDYDSNTSDFSKVGSSFPVVFADGRSQGMLFWGFAAGCLTTILTFFSIKLPERGSASMAGEIVKLVLVLCASGYVAMVITLFHYPSGH